MSVSSLGRALTAAALVFALSAPRVASADEEPAPRPVAEKKSGRFEFGYDLERGAYIRTTDGAWEINPYAMVQLQNVTVAEIGKPATTSFKLKAGKFILHGHIFHPTLTYHFQMNVGDGKVAAEDIYLRWDPLSEVGLLVGQNEVPFNRQHITLEAYQQFVERSSVDAQFNLQRDIGVATYLADRKHRFEATGGMWNGARQNAINDDPSYLGTLRLALNPFGPIAFREADLADSKRPKLSVAAAAAYNPKRVVPDSTGTKSTTLHHIAQGVGEVTLRWRGLSLSTEVHLRRQEKKLGQPLVDYGGFLQMGVFVVPKHFELVARGAALAGDLGAHDPYREVSGGANYYFLGHRLKAQADYAYLVDRSSVKDHRVRLQLEFFL
jgi:hypothetical protein